MRHRGFTVLLLGAALIGCGPSSGASEGEPTDPDSNGEPAPEVVTTAERNADPTAAAGAEPAGVEALRTGPHADDSTLCADPTAALHALMPEAFEDAEDLEPPAESGGLTRPRLPPTDEDGHPELPAPRE